MEKVEQLRPQLQEAEERLAKLRAEFEEFEAEADKLRAELEAQKAEVAEDRAAALEGVNRNELQMYDDIFRMRDGEAVVAAHGDICTGCFTRITPNDAAVLASGSRIVTCKACGRILSTHSDSATPRSRSRRFRGSSFEESASSMRRPLDAMEEET
jgi:predicted  nucleic acid-binding Zn-ribbon protein